MSEVGERYVISMGDTDDIIKKMCEKIAFMFLTMEDTQFTIFHKGGRPSLIRTIYTGNPSIMDTLRSWQTPVDDWLDKVNNIITNPNNGSRITFDGMEDMERIYSMRYNYAWVYYTKDITEKELRLIDCRMTRYNRICDNKMYFTILEEEG